ncbi:hypothetical protein IQ227_17025 [Anabaena aphanizomenioides LEGE 00250]|uniref:Uncharacterized protein n=1 Tax=Sphaerospermopsis aphanizomenoides LEGE 00250 TaxID=2777972 RepID=A0ABR9VGQ7_9CYAN|nr:hypothetical protein [Sphaerospermopsis sp. LEGE 00249]MBE9237682.1 hypothetical protein [Sphaerospermopsis aphanizomenoides LEGE 00250]
MIFENACNLSIIPVCRCKYKSFFQRRFTRSVIARNQINLLIYEPKQEIIVKWQ